MQLKSNIAGNKWVNESSRKNLLSPVVQFLPVRLILWNHVNIFVESNKFSPRKYINRTTKMLNMRFPVFSDI